MLFIATPIFAAEIRLDAHKSEVSSGDQFSIDVIIHSDEPLNAVEGRLVFPTEQLVIKEIHEGNSVLNFWLEKPHVEIPGIVVFSGITPGGFSGANNKIFSVVFEAKNTGYASVALRDIKAMKNDGLGTVATLLIRDTVVSVKPGDSNFRREVFTDIEPPEDFTPTIENNSSIFDGKYFIVFTTQDKISGVDHYEVREGKWGWFRVSSSPYLLKYQGLDRNIFVKVVDKSGNERVVVLDARQQTPWYRHYAVPGILLIMLAVGLLLKKTWLKFTR
ncbi:MAG: cohesin domain-containing protein [Patescibacteria group bacterium]